MTYHTKLENNLSTIKISWMLAKEDMKSRYARTVLGPFWIVISNTIWALTLAVVSAQLFNQPLEEHLLFVLAGLLVWNFIASILLEGCSCFITSEAVIKNFPLSLMVPLLRFIFRSVIIFFHNFLVILIALLLMRKFNMVSFIYVAPSLIVLFTASIGPALILGFINSRFRDFHQLMISCVNILPFITPIFWNRNLLSKHAWLADLNPFYHFVVIVREPLLKGTLPLESLLIALVITIVILTIAYLIFKKYQQRLIFWI